MKDPVDDAKNDTRNEVVSKTRNQKLNIGYSDGIDNHFSEVEQYGIDDDEKETNAYENERQTYEFEYRFYNGIEES